MLVHLRPLCGSRGAVGRVAGRPPGNAEDLNLHSVSAVMVKGKHPVPFRTRKLSPSAPMVLRGGPRGRVGRRRTSCSEGRFRLTEAALTAVPGLSVRAPSGVRGAVRWLTWTRTELRVQATHRPT